MSEKQTTLKTWAEEFAPRADLPAAASSPTLDRPKPTPQTTRPTSGEISAAIQIWQTSEPGSEGENEAARRMADLLRRFLPSPTER